MINRILKISFWGTILWFPFAFILLLLAVSGVLSAERMAIVGDVAAVIIGVFTVSLWLFSIVRLFTDWGRRTVQRNIIYFFLLFMGSIIGAMIFYILDCRKNDASQP